MAPSAAESAGQSDIRAALDSGLEALSAQQQVVFTRYSRVALSIDGSVFWVQTPQTLTAKGLLHTMVDREQSEDETVSKNTAFFSSETLVSELNAIAEDSIWIALLPTGPAQNQQYLQIAFSSRGSFFREADIFHYQGVAVMPAMQSQIISDASQIPAGPIVSNSLPIWLTMNSYIPASGTPVTVPVYPSYLIPSNIVPPYIAVHIEPSGTTALSAMPLRQDPGVQQPSVGGATPFYNFSVSQQMSDEVELILYGFTNETAWQYQMGLYEASLIPMPGTTLPPFGFMSEAVIRDEKRTQVEIATVAMKKKISFRAFYYQGAANAIARRLILEAMVSSVTVEGPAI